MKLGDVLKGFLVVTLLVLLCACHDHPDTYRVVVAARDLPAGTVIQAADVKVSEVAIADAEDAIESGYLPDDLTRFIGQTTKVRIPKDYVIEMSQVEP